MKTTSPDVPNVPPDEIESDMYTVAQYGWVFRFDGDRLLEAVKVTPDG